MLSFNARPPFLRLVRTASIQSRVYVTPPSSHHLFYPLPLKYCTTIHQTPPAFTSTRFCLQIHADITPVVYQLFSQPTTLLSLPTPSNAFETGLSLA